METKTKTAKPYTVLGKDKPYLGSEDDLQIACVNYARYQHSKALVFAVPNGGQRNSREAAKLKRTGTLAGVSDILVLTPSRGYAGMAIELKAKKGKMSDYQKAFMEKVAGSNFKAVVVYNYESFQHCLEWYFGKLHVEPTT